MAGSSSSSARTGSIQSHDSPKDVLRSKADPNAALYEAQPSSKRTVLHLTSITMSTYTQFAVAVNAEPGTRDTFSLRSMQHKDREGKIISMLPRKMETVL